MDLHICICLSAAWRSQVRLDANVWFVVLLCQVVIPCEPVLFSTCRPVLHALFWFKWLRDVSMHLSLCSCYLLPGSFCFLMSVVVNRCAGPGA